MNKAVWIGVLALITTGSAHSVMAATTETPAQSQPVVTAQPQLLALQTIGEGSFHYLFWHLYDAKLQSQDGRFIDYQQTVPLVLSLTYQRDISRDDFVDATLDQWRHLYGKLEPRHQQWGERLKEIWPNVAEGDTLSCQRVEGAEVQFYLNNQFLGAIKDPLFADEFLDIWLSEKTSATKLRQQLLKLQ